MATPSGLRARSPPPATRPTAHCVRTIRHCCSIAPSPSSPGHMPAPPPARLPGPRSLVLSTLRYLRDPYGALLRSAGRHGDPYTFPTFLGNMVITGDPAGVKTLLSADADTYDALGAEL